MHPFGFETPHLVVWCAKTFKQSLKAFLTRPLPALDVIVPGAELPVCGSSGW